MRLKLFTVFTCLLLLVAFSIPLMQNANSTLLQQNAMLSPANTYGSKTGSIEWQLTIKNTLARGLAVTSNESYIYVAGGNWTDPTNSSSWKPMLWKFETLGSQVWNTTLEVQGSTIAELFSVVLSPDESKVYAGGYVPNGTHWDIILVEFNATNGEPGWNYTLSGPSYDYIGAIAVSPDGEQVYAAVQLSKYSGTSYNSSFYVFALNSSNGNEIWHYELYNTSHPYAYASGLTVSPIDEIVYVSGHYEKPGSSYLSLVALNASNSNEIWNLTSTTYSSIYTIDISSDGKKLFGIALPPPNYQLLTINATDGSMLDNVSLSSVTSPYSFAIPPNETKVYTIASYFEGKDLLVAEYNLTSGEMTGVISAPDSHTYSYDVVASGDNESVYVSGYHWSSNGGNVNAYMFLLKGEPKPIIPLQLWPLLLYMMYFQTSTTSSLMNSYLLGIGIAVILVVASLSIVIILKRR
ncbi:MAG: PQQ-binding-like beta-propeller repeat protein [Candidatus Lokiarchaeia archaeon]